MSDPITHPMVRVRLADLDVVLDHLAGLNPPSWRLAEALGDLERAAHRPPVGPPVGPPVSDDYRRARGAITPDPGSPPAEEVIRRDRGGMSDDDRARLAAFDAVASLASLAALGIPKPTPDEDGVYSLFGSQKIWAHQFGAVVCMDSGPTFRHSMFTPDLAEALGAALIAAAQDARRIAAEAAQEEP